MNERRGFLTLTGALVTSGLVGCANSQQQSSSGAGVCTAFDKARQDAVSPDQSASDAAGRQRQIFVNGRSVNCDLLVQVKATADGQAPFAAVVGCIDSRVPPELVFDQQIGDIFAARIAGNFVNTDIIGSLSSRRSWRAPS